MSHVNPEEFECRLQEGQAAEFRLAMLFLVAGWMVDYHNCGHRHDFWISKNHIPEIIEVKNEDKFVDSGNICLELYQGIEKKPSGLSTSEATVFIHTFKNMVFLYRSQPMRIYIKKNQFIAKDFSGADNYNGGLILPIEYFQNYSWADYCLFANIANSKLFNSGTCQ